MSVPLDGPNIRRNTLVSGCLDFPEVPFWKEERPSMPSDPFTADSTWPLTASGAAPNLSFQYDKNQLRTLGPSFTVTGYSPTTNSREHPDFLGPS